MPSRGAVQVLSQRAIVAQNDQEVVVFFTGGFPAPAPPQSGRVAKITVKSEDAALDGGNTYDVTIWSTDVTTPLNRATFRVFEALAVAVLGGSADERPDLDQDNQGAGFAYGCQTTAGAFPHNPAFQIQIRTNAAQLANREFRIVLEVQGQSTADVPTPVRFQYAEQAPY